MTYVTRSAAETIALGRTLATALRAGDVVAFYGDLGAGKTTMIKGICAGLGVTDVVKSPSFVIASEYQGRLPIYHIDLYRLDANSDYSAFGFDDYLAGEGVCLIEWAERAEQRLPASAIRVRLTVVGSERQVVIEGLAAALKPAE